MLMLREMKSGRWAFSEPVPLELDVEWPTAEAAIDAAERELGPQTAVVVVTGPWWLVPARALASSI